MTLLEIRDYAAQHGITEQDALKQGMQEQAVKFVKGGSEIYK